MNQLYDRSTIIIWKDSIRSNGSRRSLSQQQQQQQQNNNQRLLSNNQTTLNAAAPLLSTSPSSLAQEFSDEMQALVEEQLLRGK